MGRPPRRDVTVDGSIDLSPDRIDHMVLEATDGTVLIKGTQLSAAG
jgi:hypothetical protein